jgi:hypothetical protein
MHSSPCHLHSSQIVSHSLLQISEVARRSPCPCPLSPSALCGFSLAPSVYLRWPARFLVHKVALEIQHQGLQVEGGPPRQLSSPCLVLPSRPKRLVQVEQPSCSGQAQTNILHVDPLVNSKHTNSKSNRKCSIFKYYLSTFREVFLFAIRSAHCFISKVVGFLFKCSFVQRTP